MHTRVCRGLIGVLMLLAGVIAGPAAAAQAAPIHWIGTWAASAQPDANLTLTDQTVRNIVHVSAGGSRVSVRLTNAFGGKPAPPGDAFADTYTLNVAKATIGLAQRGSAAVQGSTQVLTFGGDSSVEVPPGADVWSDPVRLPVRARSNLAISVYVHGQSPNATFHSDTHQTNYLAAGDHAADISGDAFTTTTAHWFFLDAVDVAAPARRGSVVTLGDSITDGAASTLNTNHRWPDYLARRLIGAQWPVRGVLNEGIDGNEILHDFDCCGGNPNAQERLDRDVLSQDGVRDVILLEGINDIGHHGSEITAARITQGYRHLIERAHRKGLRVIGGTLTPFENTTIPGYYSPQKEATREAVNQFIRTSGAFDGVVDFDRALRDPSHPLSMRPAYDSGDHLHPNDAGDRAMAAAVNLSLLR
jgi:lysophospholipase L1-like esterase